MSSVVQFKKPAPLEPADPHISGKAVCTACQYRWVAVAPVGTTELRCPKCDTMRGLYVNPCWPPGDELIWRCNCGGTLFIIRGPERGFMCRECGTTQSFNVLDVS